MIPLNVSSNEYDYARDDGTFGQASSDGYLEAVNQDLARDYQELVCLANSNVLMH